MHSIVVFCLFVCLFACLNDRKAVDGVYPCFAKQHLTEEKNFELEWLIQDFAKSKDRKTIDKNHEENDEEQEKQTT
jgi:hypothetical protein